MRPPGMQPAPGCPPLATAPAGGAFAIPSMTMLLRLVTLLIERVVAGLTGLASLLFISIAFNPRLGPLRHLASAAVAYLLFAFALVYVAAPIRGYVGHFYMGEKIRYDAERDVYFGASESRKDGMAAGY